MTHNQSLINVDILDKLKACRVCKLLPSLLTMDVGEFDYNRLEDIGCIQRNHQLVCRGCQRSTPIFSGIDSALDYWNCICSIGADDILSAIRYGS